MHANTFAVTTLQKRTQLVLCVTVLICCLNVRVTCRIHSDKAGRTSTCIASIRRNRHGQAHHACQLCQVNRRDAPCRVHHRRPRCQPDPHPELLLSSARRQPRSRKASSPSPRKLLHSAATPSNWYRHRHSDGTGSLDQTGSLAIGRSYATTRPLIHHRSIGRVLSRPA